MFIDLSEVLSVNDRTLEVSEDISMEHFETNIGAYEFVGDKTFQFTFTHCGKRAVLLSGKIKATLAIPCDRCLEPVNTQLDIKISKEINLGEDVDDETRDEMKAYISEEGVFDSESFVYNEILVNLPMKVLCSPDCKGICNRCGTNLNYGSCDCDTKELDPRMAKVLDVFNQFKEV